MSLDRPSLEWLAASPEELRRRRLKLLPFVGVAAVVGAVVVVAFWAPGSWTVWAGVALGCMVVSIAALVAALPAPARMMNLRHLLHAERRLVRAAVFRGGELPGELAAPARDYATVYARYAPWQMLQQGALLSGLLALQLSIGADSDLAWIRTVLMVLLAASLVVLLVSQGVGVLRARRYLAGLSAPAG
ncbi:hypothetical protein [Homoserinibacter sp. YIM 151385]|uniref:hypothetical protein n=1 Tax=Homoserinibacter sp. YIM 151385 TaxID=2985506 RepID=UPI0022EFE070|nr:hypothetical protein [Homoserinibacter sp. YIM 151385]WBU37022.1 hypothetical protein OF852_08790 [Homoserinibacter sp. YIM 151385]